MSRFRFDDEEPWRLWPWEFDEDLVRIVMFCHLTSRAYRLCSLFYPLLLGILLGIASCFRNILASNVRLVFHPRFYAVQKCFHSATLEIHGTRVTNAILALLRLSLIELADRFLRS